MEKFTIPTDCQRLNLVIVFQRIPQFSEGISRRHKKKKKKKKIDWHRGRVISQSLMEGCGNQNRSNPPQHGAVSYSKSDSGIGEITSHVCKTGQCTSAEIIAL